MLADSIQDLVAIWGCWMEANRDFMDPCTSKDSRHELARECEYLISQRYKAMDEIDRVFDEQIGNRTAA